MITSPADRLLADATRRVRSDDLTGALDGLLGAWRRARHAELAARIRTLGDYLGAILPPITGDNDSHRHEQWLARAAEAQPVDQLRLVEGFALHPMTRIYQRLQWVASQPTDPRWTPYVVRLAVRHARDYWPRLAPSPRRIWAICVKILMQMQDPASIDGLDPRYLPVNTNRRDPRSAYAAFIERIDDLRQRLRAFTPGDAPSDALLTDFDAALAKRKRRPKPDAKSLRRPSNRQAAELLALVYREPADVDVRRVYADWLEATGAPWAELMRLQLQQLDAPKPSKAIARKITRLTERYGARWLGQLTPFVRNVEWHLGFPSAADVVFRSAEQRDTALKLDAWRTFTAVHVRDAAVLHHPTLAGVAQVGRTASLLSSQPRLTPVTTAVMDGVRAALPVQRLVLDSFAVAGLRIAHWPALQAVDVVVQGGVSDISRLVNLDCPMLTFWGVDPTDILPIARAFGRTSRLCFADRAGFRYRLEQGDGRKTLDLIWAPAQLCVDFESTLLNAHVLGPQSIRILTPNHSQPAEFLHQWRAGLDPIPIALPRARRRLRPAQ